ncbi:hypothetical protein [Amycolatopsis sp. CA-230715]|uniref:hypothetical protein n=1 Tax=Amycolatopsis sp. CA-230715 TaxID=2745196 RepID=UPI001C0257F7|nr:hypothetical protein [Amycolatopsis sp. CA-230715]QWF79763.1 hypothetical protein HUW46_03175 [Amycolatopsis sp. CA-230715]
MSGEPVRGTIEWQANGSVSFFACEVDMVVPEDEPGWETTATIVTEMSEEDREGLLCLLDIDPFFTLWLSDRGGDGIEVEMGTPDQSGRVRLREVLAAEYDGGAQAARRF